MLAVKQPRNSGLKFFNTMELDLFELRKYVENGVAAHVVKVGIAFMEPTEYQLGIIEDGKVVSTVQINSETARDNILAALRAEIEFSEEQARRIASGEPLLDVQKPKIEEEVELPF